jgi:hypothetical protein
VERGKKRCYANHRNTTAQKALKAIQNAERSKLTYIQIHEITGHNKDKNPLTQVDISDTNETSKLITLTTEYDLEKAVIRRNQHNARQSLVTHFAAIPELSAVVDPHNQYD